ncbi:NADH-ubiquinone oxidoreductase-F iron-sulfur binding region domain-containing protein [Nocardia callitridis]|uniref:NADH-ubiquinone oxidoreductase-F iron-sulfur binding region domain-containing protein n=1 Tax=Nocardia callitridis TaxID=648753 RepID=A0ABP9KT41_9NOCA
MHTTSEPIRELVVAAAHCRPRLLRTSFEGGADVEGLAEYRNGGGYRRLESADALLAEIERSGLLGRGGAAFPLGTKLRSVRDAGRRGRTPVVVANGEEGEPASAKDKWLMRHRPHLVLDGARLAAHLIAAETVHLYVSDAESARRITEAMAELDESTLAGLTVGVRTVEPGYVAGEETAAVRALNGGPALPSDKPPRPFQHGVDGRPTAVSNVETLANLPFLHSHGGEEFRTEGTERSSGTILATLTGAGLPPALYELPLGIPFTEVLALHGVAATSVRGVLMGGYFAGLLNRDILDATLDHETLRGLGSGLGCGAISLLTTECPVAVAASVLTYFDRENAGQCGSCFNGTAAMAAAARGLRDGLATAEDLTRLERWSVVLRGRGACATLDGAANIAASLLSRFPDEVARHLETPCQNCRSGAFDAARPYEVEAVTHP